ncbi:MAG: aromatic ring-hydroxylating dioxygenase subunit alpha [Parvibaculaceae bacterium]
MSMLEEKRTTARTPHLPAGNRGRVTLDPLSSPTLPSRYYTDVALYREEMRKVHQRSWCYVGHVSDVREPGMYFTDMVGEQPILVVRGQDGEVRAFYNVCQHRGHELLKGAGRLKTKGISCPYHAWLYRLDGTLAAAPMTGELKGFDKTDFKLKPVSLGIAAGLIFVNLDSDCGPFEIEMQGFGRNIESFLPGIADWVVAERLHYDIKANWKVVVDNFSEAYHIPIAHPQLSKVLEQEMVEFVEQRRWTFNRFKSKEGFPGLELTPGSPYYAWQAWPHLCMLSLPGSDNLVVLRMAPDGIAACAERVDIYTPAGAAENDPKLLAVRDLFMHMFNIEDIGIVESVQRGLSSLGFDQGRYVCDEKTSWFSEIQLHWFHMQVLDAMDAKH